MKREKKYYTKKDIVNAGCNLEPLRCPKCKAIRNTGYNQYGRFAWCENCGHTW